jgi:hypothetical protein
MKLIALQDVDDGCIITSDDGVKTLIRPKSDTLMQFAKSKGIELRGIELGVLDYSYMERNWDEISLIYTELINAQLSDHINPPKTFDEFRHQPFDVYKGIKKYTLYLTKEYSISRQRHSTWFFKNNKRCFIGLSQSPFKLENELEDIIETVQNILL